MEKEQPKMTAKKLIEALSKFPPDSIVIFALQTATQVYPSVYVSMNSTIRKEGDYEVFVEPQHSRVTIHLPEGYSISERKKK